MGGRKTIDERLRIQIKPATDYRQDITFEELCATKAQPTDRVLGFEYVETEPGGFGMMDQDKRTFYYPALVVIRKRQETDDEYFKRQKEEQDRKIAQDDRDRLEYLRLKAKFEK